MATTNTGQTAKKNRFIWSEDLCDFLSAVDSYQPTVPDALSAYYIEKSGVTIKDDRISKLVSLAADRFLSEVVNEAKQISILRQHSVKNVKRRTEMSETLENEDLEGSLAQMRVYLRRKKVKIED
jgi:transcription initiation factor TFIID subunit 10